MDKLEFTAPVGDKHIDVEIEQPNGAGGQYFITIDKRHHGAMMKINGEWVGHLNNKSFLTTTDIALLGEMIDSEERRRSSHPIPPLRGRGDGG